MIKILFINENNWYVILFILFPWIVFFITRSFRKPIEVVKDRFGNLAFKVYQLGGNKFIVKGYNGFPRKVNFNRYTDVKSFIDNHTQVIK